MADETKKRDRIKNETVVALFPIVAAVGRKELHRPDGIRQIVKDHGLKENSARGLVDNFGKMLKGEEYQRLNSVFVTEYFLKKINEDFEPEHLRNAVAAITKHLKYYEGVTGSGQHSIRRILQRYSDLIPTAATTADETIAKKARELDDEGAFDPNNDEDARKWILTTIAQRQGQPGFRTKLLKHYGGRCAITGCAVEEVLEAAHILRYFGKHTHHSTNGLLLRSDLHTLFDRRLLAIDPDTMKVLVSPALKGSIYEKNWAGKKMRLPKDKTKWPNKTALQRQREEAGF